MRRFALLAALPLFLATPAQADPRADWARASDWGRTGLGIAALGAPAVGGDWRSARQSLLAMSAASLATGALKVSIHERRPDSSDQRSFPSGHTALSFAAAASLDARFGLRAGIPAHVLAGLVGLARVRGGKHYWHDVAVGALIGEVAGRLIVDRSHGHRPAPPMTMALRVAF